MKYFLVALLLAMPHAQAHSIYSNLMTKNDSSGWRCCGGPDAGSQQDCWPTIYREAGEDFEFRTPDGDWVRQPVDRIQFIPIPGDTHNVDHAAHLCSRIDAERIDFYRKHGFGRFVFQTVSGKEIIVYCAVIPPSGS